MHFLDGFMWFPVFLVPLCRHIIWNVAGSHFQISNPHGGNKSVLEQKKCSLDGFMWFPVFLAPLC